MTTTPNPQAGEVALTVGTRTYLLKLTHNKAAIAEDVLGKSIWQIDGGGVRYVRALLYCLTHDQGIDSLDEAGDLLDEDSLEITAAVNKATALFFRTMYAEKNPVKKKAPAKKAA